MGSFSVSLRLSGLLGAAVLMYACSQDTQQVKMKSSAPAQVQQPPAAAAVEEGPDRAPEFQESYLNLVESIERTALSAGEPIPDLREEVVSEGQDPSLNLVDDGVYAAWKAERARLLARMNGGIKADKAACEQAARVNLPGISTVPEAGPWMANCTAAKGVPLRQRANEMEARRDELRRDLNQHCPAGASGSDHRDIPKERRWTVERCHELRKNFRDRVQAIGDIYNELYGVGMACTHEYNQLVAHVATQNAAAQAATELMFKKVAECAAGADAEFSAVQTALRALNAKIAAEEAERSALARREDVKAVMLQATERLFWLGQADEVGKELYNFNRALLREKFGPGVLPSEYCRTKAPEVFIGIPPPPPGGCKAAQ